MKNLKQFWKKLKYWQKVGILFGLLHIATSLIVLFDILNCPPEFCWSNFSFLMLDVFIGAFPLLKMNLAFSIKWVIWLVISFINGFVLGAIIGSLIGLIIRKIKKK